MANPKKLEYTALLGIVLQLAFTLTCWILVGQSQSWSVGAEMWHLAIGVPVWMLVLVHGRQRRLARQEQEELEQLRETRLSEEIFEDTELDTMRASTALLIFEKYVVLVATLLLSGALLFASYYVYSYLFAGGRPGVPPGVEKPVVVAVGMIFIAFLGFLIGKYSAGLAQAQEFRLLRAAGGYMLGNVLACVLIVISMGMYHFGVSWGETIVTYAIPAGMGLVGLELILNLILDIYRPRVPGKVRRPPYDSRLLGLFAEPGGVLKTVAATLDYQFGFQVSETWFYRFMERAIVPLALIWLVGLWMLSSIVVVDPDEVAFVETLGKPYVSAEDAATGLRATVLPAGFHLKWPWPISVSRVVPAYRVQAIELGKIYEPKPGVDLDPRIRTLEDPDVILWRERHIDPSEGYEANFLVPSTGESGASGAEGTPGEAAEGESEAGQAPPEEATAPEPAPLVELGMAGSLEAQLAAEAPDVNLARLLAEVHFRLKQKPDGTVDERAAFTYCYAQTQLEEHLRKLAYRALCRVAASQDFIKWIADERGETVREFERLLRKAIDREQLGVEVVFAGVEAVHPPPATAFAYEDVVTALENKESSVLEGDVEEVRMVEGARGFRAAELAMAGGYRAQIVETARAERDQFLVRLAAYQKAPLVYLFRNYFDTIEAALGGQDIFVVPRTDSEVDIIDMAPQVRPQLLDLDTAEE
ncbi:MAG: SPFH domain-containing protein [Candidatus Brocadiaceae bacterium]|jgi:regulator of protease activity HflC (stomatin/prohibitin superfamily)